MQKKTIYERTVATKSEGTSQKMRPQSYSPFKCLPWRKYMYTVYYLYTTKNDIEFDLIDTCKRQIISSSWILTNHTQEPWTYEPSNLIILLLVPYQALPPPSCAGVACGKASKEARLTSWESKQRTPCTEHAQKQMLQNRVPHSSIFYGLIQNNISCCQIPENRPKMSKIYQNTMYTMIMII